jgi:hypothetical protein
LIRSASAKSTTPVQMPSSSSFSHRHARASALTSVLSGWGLAPGKVSLLSGATMRFRPGALETRAVSIVGTLTVSLLSAAAR